MVMGSRLLPKKYFKEDPAGLAKALRQGQDVTLGQPGGAVQSVLLNWALPSSTKYNGKTSIHPVWYDSYVLAIYSGMSLLCSRDLGLHLINASISFMVC